jgi:hypothetical protein
MWHPNAKLGAQQITPPPQEPRLPSGLGPLLRLVCDEYLPYLASNEAQWLSGQGTHSWLTQGASFKAPVSTYRVWCWQTLRVAFQQLAASDRDRLMRWFMEIGDAALKRNIQALLESSVPPEALTPHVPWHLPQNNRAGKAQDRQWSGLP